MIRTPLRPLARILQARVRGENPDAIERENLRLRHEAMRDAGRRRAEGRLLLTAVTFLAVFLVIGARMGLLAASSPAVPQSVLAEGVQGGRADILDRNGRVLATNLATNALYAEMRYMVDPVRAARELGRIFPDIDAERLERQLSDPNRSFLWVRAHLSPEQEQQVHEIGEPGLLFGQRHMRLYPNGRLAAHVLGGAAFGEQGVRAAEIIGTAGIEHYFDTRLRDPERLEEPLRLSLDLPAQAVVQDVLAAGMRTLNAKGATAVMMDVHTGEVMAMVSLPDFDPNSRPAPPTQGEPADSPLFNRAVQGYYELGSVMKTLTVAQALDSGEVQPETVIDIRGPLRWGRFSIRDFRNYGNELSVTRIMVKSSNIGTARLAQRMGAERQRAFLEKLGMLAPSGVELAEAVRAHPQFSDNWSELATMTISYGHGLSTSPVQLAAAYSSLVNGGTRITPTLLRQSGPQRGEQVISQLTSDQVRVMLRAVVEEGTASFARVPGYAVGGKTGTADKPDPRGGYYEDRVIATFASVFPSNDPRFVLIVTMDEPVETTGSEPRRTAGWTAVPVGAEIIRRVAPLMGMSPLSATEIETAMQNSLSAVR
ncbi:peptidoglycan D,D-transpeptidase FtsI family protein [Roseicitreum antarcticum]|uniref:Cell division protein FtsI (Penicillin-binding protein 3) n=1 Tax=Roseicitreum antarcticum TaxID=564137 RepID=A0A1H3BLS0_9RHOB|nr:penicillin-binding protein 2 [Roseicitreum antarcticum]SDX42725.1 cell division protein FtsI (penicillin-binding protein 3) [Roseicitreum antarcticum]